MRRQEVIDRLQRHRAEVAVHGVRALYLFGSTGRDDAGPESDVDLFVDYEEGFSLLTSSLKEDIDRVLGVEADLTTRGGLHPVLRNDILRDAERVF